MNISHLAYLTYFIYTNKHMFMSDVILHLHLIYTCLTFKPNKVSAPGVEAWPRREICIKICLYCLLYIIYIILLFIFYLVTD